MVQAFAVADGDTSFTRTMYVSSASLNSSGAMEVYFNRSVDHAVYPPLPAQGNVQLENKLMDRIDAARYSIDLCFYSLSGRVGDDIASRILAAQSRGVNVRAIFESQNANTNAIRTIRNNCPAILDDFDRVNAGAGLMHNKFVIIDARDRSSDTDDWVMTGSWNPTDPGTDDDAQNVVFIQDQALATTYTAEFEEMWGSGTDTPNSTVSRFGARKLDNTPHRFLIDGSWVESRFSPSDGTTGRLVDAVENAERSVYFAVLTFTRDDLANAMVEKHNAGVAVRGVMDNSSDQGTEYPYLQSSGIDVHLKSGIPGLLHHKYMIVDGENAGVRSAVLITGSHNWSNSAEFSNNENTLFIRGRDVILQYLQEWQQRYRDAGGTATIVLSAGMPPRPDGLALSANWPNPFGDAGTSLRLTVERSAAVRVTVHDVLGRQVAVLADGVYAPGAYDLGFMPDGMASGTYVVRLAAGGSTSVRRMLLKR
jgi:phosphatidylserine/phosphatidylglycerophosphate/cardiolipin synthase-like enzyme